ncbi:uncharacterized protein EV154DRAFT_485981 [Mucor mucedo]|uniref:uncharacterized protein n=1 Tax=Mucor mucedo TaxID=29922 RepID=UPI002220403C|nr:uncharacterized protein EV154DRAFT_485981 [Mucor mucedo]KAI7880025.1 hypothetical protein EV154DRAFT_485981 [Mucor mucedo]
MAPIPQEQLDDTAQDISRVTTVPGRKQRGSICRQEHQAAFKIRIMATRARKREQQRMHCMAITNRNWRLAVWSLTYKMYRRTSLNENAQQILISRRLENNATNRFYRRVQLLIKLAVVFTVSFISIILLASSSKCDMHADRSYAATTIQVLRASVTHLHKDPILLGKNEEINAFITALLNQAPAVTLHRPTISS